MNSHVLDASAVLAVLNDEKGAETVLEALSSEGTVISAVNYSEVVSKLASLGMPPEVVDSSIDSLGLTVVPFDKEAAREAGLFFPSLSKFGLSLGDRACLALSKMSGLPALTSDKAWSNFKFHPKIRVVR